jgi:SRSO17 transposase
VSLSLATWDASLPIAYRLYLPKDWEEDAEWREKAEVPEQVEFQTKPEIALEQIRAAVAAQVVRPVVLADAAASAPADRRVRPGRHTPHFIATRRVILARHLLGQVPQCPFCGSRAG